MKKYLICFFLVLCIGALPVGSIVDRNPGATARPTVNRQQRKKRAHLTRKQKKALKRAEQAKPGCAEPKVPGSLCA